MENFSKTAIFNAIKLRLQTKFKHIDKAKVALEFICRKTTHLYKKNSNFATSFQTIHNDYNIYIRIILKSAKISSWKEESDNHGALCIPFCHRLYKHFQTIRIESMDHRTRLQRNNVFCMVIIACHIRYKRSGVEPTYNVPLLTKAQTQYHNNKILHLGVRGAVIACSRIYHTCHNNKSQGQYKPQLSRPHRHLHAGSWKHGVHTFHTLHHKYSVLLVSGEDCQAENAYGREYRKPFHIAHLVPRRERHSTIVGSQGKLAVYRVGRQLHLYMVHKK